jgi:hypothetical protein
MVKLILFVHKNAQAPGDRLIQSIKANFKDIPIDVCTDVKGLEKTLPPNWRGVSLQRIFILLMDCDERLEQVFPFVDLFERERILIVLPDSNQASIKKTSRFYPRYTTQISNEYRDVIDVISKMIQN